MHGYFGDLVVNPNATGHIFACGSAIDYMALYFSLDEGSSWITRPVAGVSGYANAVAVDVLNDQIIYLGGYVAAKPALFKSDNRGEAWTNITGSIAGIITSLAVDPGSSSRVYAGTPGGVYKSENGGSSWIKKSSFDAACLKVNPVSPNEVFAGGASGLFRSIDFGNTWVSVADGMPVSRVSSFDMIPEARILYAGTMGGGVYKKNLSDMYALIIKAGPGGTTSPAPGTYFYNPGASVEIEAIPDKHYRFTGWSGSLSGTSSPIAIVMNTDMAAVANFAINIFAPLNFAGLKKVNRSLLFSQYVNVLSWQAHPDNVDVAKYRIYLVNGSVLILVAEVSANTLEYRHINVKKDEAYAYALCAVTSLGQEGEFAYVAVK
jgi:hypothetical protein